MSRRFARSVAGVAALVGAVGTCGLAQAGYVPTFLMTWDASADGLPANTYNWLQEYGGYGEFHGFGDWTVPMDSRTWTGWRYSGALTNLEWDFEWNCVFNNAGSVGATGGGSAFVTANIVVSNNSPSTQNFTLLMSMPLARAILSPSESGSIVGTVTDLNFNDAVVSAPAGASIYTARIDTVDEQSLMVDPFSQSAGGPLQSHIVGPADFGIPSPIPASQDADTSIALFLNFNLSAGDSASFTAIFEVIPGPGALPVLAAFGLLGGRRRRRV
jgi:uncharacterized protein (TIGR03382 family)